MAKALQAHGEMNRHGEGKSKRLSVERIYQKKTQLEHILLRPDTYIGSIEEVTQSMWVHRSTGGGAGTIVQKSITFVPGLYKIFDEIVVNAADNKQRDPSMRRIEIDIDPENNTIRIWNDGKGIPVEIHRTEKMYVPTMIFGELLTSSNYDDTEKKVTGGRNGYGAKLCNIFSRRFTVETACKESGKKFKQTWHHNMSSSDEPQVTSFSGKDYTCVTFTPDLTRFNMEKLDRDIIALMTRRAYDLAGSSRGVNVYLNKEKIPIRSFREYVDLYLKSAEDPFADDEGPVAGKKVERVVHTRVGERWEVCVTPSASGFQQVSFVNSIATTKGGSHIAYLTGQLVDKIAAAVKKKNKGGMEVKPHQVKSHLWIFANCLIENPSFDSQTKENMTLKAKNFGSACALDDDFVKKVVKCGVVDLMVQWAKFKSQAQLRRNVGSTSKQTKLKGIPKLDDANHAGGKDSSNCTLILTEGDSAKTLAVSGLSVVGRDHYGVFPLRGKVLNVREATHKQIKDNAEINNIIRIVGLKYGKDYSSVTDLKGLRYGRLMIMTDQDQDGSHIKGLLINFIHHNWPGLLRLPFLEQFITPIVKVFKGRSEQSFYSLPEFEQWKALTDDSKSWRVKYYKGLGTSTPKEAKEYFQDMERHRISFKYSGPGDDAAIKLAFAKEEVAGRKVWLTDWLAHRKEKRQAGMNESFLYGSEVDRVTFRDFVNKELVQFSNADNERSIPSLVDGLKPGQRKVVFTCFKRKDKREVKVAQLAGSVAELSAYHHGETSLMSTIIGLAQNFVGSNNINLLQPIGQFGTRLHGGKDAASPRYIFTALSPLARLIISPLDEPILTHLREDNLRIEPEWYCPTLPLVLVNGSEGIGTGYSSFVPNYDVREIVANLQRMLDDVEPVAMAPSYKGFSGKIFQVDDHKYMSFGTIARLDDTHLEITELPVRMWTQAYKEKVLETMLHGSEKIESFITDYTEYHTDTTVRFVVTLTKANMDACEKEGFHKKFKLESSLATSNLVLFDSNGCLKKYDSEIEILKEFFALRLERYAMRKKWLEGQLKAEADKLTNQARFIVEKCDGKITVENKKKKEMIALLTQRGYASDPVKAWKEKLVSSSDADIETEDDSQDEDDATASGSGPDFNYLLGMSMWSLTKEKKDELLASKEAKISELEILRGKSPKTMWREDLEKVLEELEKVEQKEKDDALLSTTAHPASKKKGKGKARLPKQSAAVVARESRPAASPDQIIAPHVPAEKVKRPRGKAAAAAAAPPKPEIDEGQTRVQDYFGGADETKKTKKLLPKKRKPVVTKLGPDSDSDDDNDTDEAEEEESPLSVRTKKSVKTAAHPAKKIVISESDDDDDEVEVVPATSSKKLTVIDEESDSDFDFESRREKPVDVREKKSAPTAAKKGKALLKPKTTAPKTTAPKKTTKKVEQPAKKPRARPAKKVPEKQSSKSLYNFFEEEDDDAPGPSKRMASVGASKRKGKPQKLAISDDEEDSIVLSVSDSDDEEEIAPKRSRPAAKKVVEKTKKAAVRPAAKVAVKRRVVADSDDDEVLPLAERIRRRDRVDYKSQTEDDDVDDADDSDEADLDESFDPRSDLD